MIKIFIIFWSVFKKNLILYAASIFGLLLIVLSSCNNVSNSINSNQTDIPQSKDGNSININFEGEHCTSDVSDTVNKNEDVQMHLNIEYFRDPNTNWKHNPDPDKENKYPEGELTVPIVEYELNYENIHVYIGGKEYIDSYTFEYQNNERNTLTIKKEYAVNDIKIIAKATPRKATLTLYGFELGETLLAKYKAGTLKIEFKNAYQNDGMKIIRTLSNSNTFPVFEDDDIDCTMYTTDGSKLPEDICFRTNSRNCPNGVECFLEYSEDGTSLHTYVPHYVVRDHGSWKLKEGD